MSFYKASTYSRRNFSAAKPISLSIIIAIQICALLLRGRKNTSASNGNGRSPINLGTVIFQFVWNRLSDNLRISNNVNGRRNNIRFVTETDCEFLCGSFSRDFNAEQGANLKLFYLRQDFAYVCVYSHYLLYHLSVVYTLMRLFLLRRLRKFHLLASKSLSPAAVNHRWSEERQWRKSHDDDKNVGGRRTCVRSMPVVGHSWSPILLIAICTSNDSFWCTDESIANGAGVMAAVLVETDNL